MRYLITSALPYVNNVPHLGNIIGCVLSADVFARFCRSRGHETLYICGTDEYGTATEAKAYEEKTTPRAICDKYHAIHKEIYEWFGISTDIFGRTSDPSHIPITQAVFNDLDRQGMLLEQEMEQPYDPKLEMFLADRFVVGTCPHCQSPDARSDQCDRCGRLLTFAELGSPRSKLSGAPPVLRKSRHLLLDLARSQPKLEAWIEGIAKEGRWSDNTLAIARSWLREGLKARSITRDLKWGVPVPRPGWEGKVLYVWFDAPIGYISITSLLRPDYMDWWSGAGDVRHYEFIGKDNVPFHAIIFPAMLLGTGKSWTLPHYISSTEFLNYESGKFSKTRGVGVFGNDAKASGIPADSWRYYLLATRPETADTTFSWDDFGKRHNSELLSNYANLVNRVLTFIANQYGGVVPPGARSEGDEAFLAAQRVKYARVGDLLEQVQLRGGLAEFMLAASAANAYLQEQEPWKTQKTDPARAGAALNTLVNTIKDLAIAGEPFLPHTSAAIWRQLGLQPRRWENVGVADVPAGHRIGAPEHLFKPLEKEFIEECRRKYAGDANAQAARDKLAAIPHKAGETGGAGVPRSASPQATANPASAGARPSAPAPAPKPTAPPAPVAPLDLAQLELEVGYILSVERHPSADRLYVEKVQMAGGEVRQICSGLVEHFKAEELQGKMCVVVKNLKPAKLRGVESQGMVLVAEGPDKALELLSPPAAAGARVVFEDVAPASPMPIITIDQFRTVGLEAVGGAVRANGRALSVEGKPVALERVKDGKVS